MIVLFALSMITILGVAGLLVDGGNAWVSRRQAQAAADTAALAAAQAAAKGTDVTTAARAIAAANGFPNAYTDCSGVPKTDGVVLNQPPATGPHAGDADFIEIITSRPMKTAFAGAVGQGCWMVSARAVSSVKTQVALCNFCALSDWNDEYTLDIDNGNDLRVDGDIYVNQDTWTAGTAADNRCNNPPGHVCSPATCNDWTGLPSDQRVLMCGTSLYVDHTGGVSNTTLSAKTISVNGGWQVRTHNDTVHAEGLAASCPGHPTYTSWATAANVCIGAPKIVDPLNDPSKPLNIIAAPDPNTLSTCPGGTYPCGPVASASCFALPGTVLKLPPGTFQSPQKLALTGVTAGGPNYTICPGLYFGGFSEFGDGHQPKVTMLPGIYFMVGGGFSVTGTATIDGSSGVMIFNSGGPEAFSSNSASDPTLIPATCPPPIGSTCKLTGGTNLVTGNGVQVGVNVSYVLTVKPGASLPKPTGTAASFKFYDGQNLIACSGGITISGTTNLVATCITSYTLFGTRGITAVYLGDSVYAPAGDTGTQVINPPATASSGNINIVTATLPCTIAPCGQVVLHAQTSGQYSGLLIFQDRSDGLGIRIAPALGAAACGANFMTDGVPPDTNPVPAPCGALGGLSGTIYANHQSTGASDWDAVVNIEVSGVANLQVIASEIHITVVNTQARFSFNANSFANGKIHLVE